MNGEHPYGNKYHKEFLERLDASRPAVWVVAQYLQSRGHSIQVPPDRAVANASEWKEGSDQGDFFMLLRGEVKHITYPFTCAEDWPFDCFMVAQKNVFDRANPKPWGYFTLNPDMTHLAFVDVAKTQKYWFVRTTKDWGIDDLAREKYCCDVSYVKFFPLTKP